MISGDGANPIFFNKKKQQLIFALPPQPQLKVNVICTSPYVEIHFFIGAYTYFYLT